MQSATEDRIADDYRFNVANGPADTQMPSRAATALRPAVLSRHSRVRIDLAAFEATLHGAFCCLHHTPWMRGKTSTRPEYRIEQSSIPHRAPVLGLQLTQRNQTPHIERINLLCAGRHSPQEISCLAALPPNAAVIQFASVAAKIIVLPVLHQRWGKDVGLTIGHAESRICGRNQVEVRPVSYTHLTLPTICSV